MRKLTGLHDHCLRDVVQLCAKNCDMPNGTISESKFVSLMSSLSEGKDVEEVVDPSRKRVMLRILARILDINKQGSLELPHISAALSLLCKTRENDKITAAFAAFDHEKYISFHEMKQYLTIIFLV